VKTGPTVALLDGPLAENHPALLSRIYLVPPGTQDDPGARHASSIAAAILAHAPSARIVNLVIFGAKLTTSAELVAKAMSLADMQDIVHCSFGLPRPDPALEAEVARLVAVDRPIIAASPARGNPVWPAQFPGVITVQGDARCGPAEWSHLALPHARFGACPRTVDQPEIAGSSIAAAHLTGHLVARFASGAARGELIERLAREARFFGPERRNASTG
jgi:hypothetical protein